MKHHRPGHRLLRAASAALAIVAFTSPAPSEQPPPSAVSHPLTRVSLLDGVDAIPPVGTVGQVAVWGPDAFAVMLADDGAKKAPIIGAGTLGAGRVMAWAHSYGSAAAAARLSTGRLLTNACRWAAGDAKVGRDRLRVALIESDLTEYLTAQGFEVSLVTNEAALAPALAQSDVVLCGRADLTDREIAALTDFVQRGGGLVCFACPWGWAQVHHKPVETIPLNRILAPAGVAFAEGYVEPGKDGVFQASGLPGDEFHAGRALDILAQVDSGTRKADDPLVRQAGATATKAVTALPADDLLLRPRLEALLKANAASLSPAPDKPLKESHALDRVLLALQLSQIESQPVASVRPHPASAAFPGAVADAAPTVSRTITIDARVPRWHSTGLYAAPGQVITVASAAGADHGSLAGMRVQIGCHTDQLWHMEVWRRVPRITASWPLDAERVQVASAFGGLIYIDVPQKAKAETITVTISGGVESPLFVLGSTTNDEWTSRIRNAPGPWAELACDRVILTIPSDVARTIDDPTAIMEHWVRVLDANADLAGIPHARPYPQRYVADVQISAGYMHSGYPIMTHLDAARFMTDAKGLVASGWGPYHEMGHNHQDGMWTFDGTGEVTCNIFTLYVLENVCGVADASQQKVTGDPAARARAKFMADGAPFAKWKSDPFLALQMYAQLRIAFGWDVYRKVFAEYRALPRSERPGSDDEKRDQWMVRMSRATGKNLGPFFQAWGVPTSDAARASLTDLEVWMPPELQKN